MQMAARTRVKTKGTYAPQPMAAPEAKKEPLKPAPPLNSIQVRDDEGEELNAKLAQYGMRVPKLGEFGEGGFRLDEGVIPRRWAREGAAVMEMARRLAAKKEQFERGTISRDEARAKAQQEKAERKAAMYKGMVSLADLLTELGEHAPSVGRARKAVERAHMIHRKFHFGPKEVEQARKVLRSVPARSVAAAASGVGGLVRQTSPAPDGFVKLRVAANPHKEGTEQHRRMAKLMEFAGKTAKDFLAAGGCKLKLKHALSQSWVTLEKEAGAPAPASKIKTPGRVARGKDPALGTAYKPAYDVKAMANADGKVRARARALPGRKARGKK